MIFLTVGTQLPFDRLTAAMAAVAPRLDDEVVAQIGSRGAERPEFACHRHLDPEAFDRLFANAKVVVAHAGMGTILTARRLGKPLVVMPRRYDLGEHRNDHQVATAARLGHLIGVEVVNGEDDLFAALNRPHDQAPADRHGPQRDRLALRLKSFIEAQPDGARQLQRTKLWAQK